MELIIATKNMDKHKEMAEILKGMEIRIGTLLDFPSIPEVEEDGETFEENAIKKARFYAEATGKMVVADDSGLEVDVLGGQPGVMSARFAGPGASGTKLCEKVLGLMSNFPHDHRTARFRCVIAIADGSIIETAEGSVEGYISHEMTGEMGFGYDPIFYYPPFGRTFAQLTMEEKNRVSHRGMALRNAKKLLDKYVAIR